VPDVELDPVIPGEGRATVHLGEAGEARANLEPAALAIRVPVDLVAQCGPRPDHGHVAPEHVPELRQLVHGEAPQDAADARDPCVALVDGEAGADVLGADGHRAELHEVEILAVLPDPRLAGEHAGSVVELDRKRRGGEERARKREAEPRHGDVGRTVHRVAAGSQAAGTPRWRYVLRPSTVARVT